MKTKDIKSMGQAYLQVLEKQMDAVNKKALKKDYDDRSDKDIDNDGDADSTDKYLHTRRKAIAKAMSKDEKMSSKEKMAKGLYNQKEANMAPFVKTKAVTAKQKAKQGMYNKEAKDLDAKNADDAIKHDCASHVEHAKWGLGDCIEEQHTIVETAPGVGYVSHYDVLFEHGVEKDVPVEDLKILAEKHHGHKPKKKKPAESEDMEPNMGADENGAKTPEAKKKKMKGDEEPVMSPVKAEKKESTQWTVYNRIQEKMNQTKGATAPEPMDSKMSPGAKAFVAMHGGLTGNESEVDGQKAAEDTIKNAAAAVKAAPGRPNDKKDGDKTMPGEMPAQPAK